VRVTPLVARNFSLWPFASKTPAAPAPAEPELLRELSTTSAAAESAPVPEVAVAQATPADGILVPSAPEVIPDAFTDAASTLTDVAHAVAAAGPSPLHWGDLTALGLTGWGPVGLSVWMLEAINVGTGLSWFSTIVVGTAISRMICMPINIMQQQNTSRLAAFQPQLLKLKEELQSTQASQDMVAMQRVILKQQSIYRDAGVSLPQMLLLPFAQLPVSLGMFFAVRRLIDHPLEQLQVSGIGELIPMYADLTVADPMYALPIATAVFMHGFLWVRSANARFPREMLTCGAAHGQGHACDDRAQERRRHPRALSHSLLPLYTLRWPMEHRTPVLRALILCPLTHAAGHEPARLCGHCHLRRAVAHAPHPGRPHKARHRTAAQEPAIRAGLHRGLPARGRVVEREDRGRRAVVGYPGPFESQVVSARRA
jgi:hypothetical protein